MVTKLENRTLYIADNINIMRQMEAKAVDLIYLDPPFNSKREYRHFVAGEKEGFKDHWAMDAVKDEIHRGMAKSNQKLYEFLRLTGHIHSNSMKAYLIMLSERIIEMHRILKDTGNICLHCDKHAAHYIKIILDCIFGKSNFINVIVWQRCSPKKATKKFSNVCDTLLLYKKTKGANFYPQSTPIGEKTKKNYTYKDENGHLFAKESCTAPTGYRYDLGCGEKTPKRPYAMPENKARQMLKEGILVAEKGKTPYLKYMWEDTKKRGLRVANLWTDIPNVNGKEAEGFSTQKPEKLLERIISALSKKGDIVFDPYCGSATTLVVAEKLNRKWIGIDVSQLSVTLLKKRIEKISNEKLHIKDKATIS